MKLLWTLAAFLLLLSVVAEAQGTIAPAPAPQGVVGGYIGGSARNVIVSSNVGGGPSSIKGAPFSADVITETDRPLADGNRIHQELHGKMFRDSQGRTRNESEFLLPLGQSLQHIFIFDPVEKLSVILDPEHKTATVNHFQSAPPMPEVRSQTTPPPQPAKHTMPELKSESLGSMQMEGFNVTGSRHTRTVAAGVMGNEKPLVTISETWVSKELGTTLSTTTDDPLSGKTTQKLVNIQTGEPDPQLFQVPPDYTVKENPPPK